MCAFLQHPVAEGLLKLLVAVGLALIVYLLLPKDTAPSLPSQQVQDTTAGQDASQLARRAIPGMKETNDLLINWTIIIFGGTIGAALLAKGPKIRDRNWSLVLIPSVWVCLYESLVHGTEFKKKLSYQTATEKFAFNELNASLFLQQTLFEYGLMTLAVLTLFVLFFRLALLENTRNDGEGQ